MIKYCEKKIKNTASKVNKQEKENYCIDRYAINKGILKIKRPKVKNIFIFSDVKYHK